MEILAWESGFHQCAILTSNLLACLGCLFWLALCYQVSVESSEKHKRIKSLWVTKCERRDHKKKEKLKFSEGRKKMLAETDKGLCNKNVPQRVFPP